MATPLVIIPLGVANLTIPKSVRPSIAILPLVNSASFSLAEGVSVNTYLGPL